MPQGAERNAIVVNCRAQFDIIRNVDDHLPLNQRFIANDKRFHTRKQDIK